MPKLPDRLNNGKLPAYAWPGGYPIFYIDNENNCLCPDCANKPGYNSEPVDGDINWEEDHMFCDYCSNSIPSAYGENNE